MNARLMSLWAGLIALATLVLVAPGAALAQCCSPPPPCCAPPTPPSPPQPCCGSGGHQVRVPGVNVQVGASVVVNASASATVNAAASGSAGGSYTIFGGGGSSFSMGSGPVSVIQGLNVEGGAARTQKTAYTASRSKIKTVVIQAFCLDDRAIPHPASQVTPDREIADSYDGELFRCLAGTRMQVTYADYLGKIAFDNGQIISCAKNEALYYSRQSSTAGLSGGPDGAQGERVGRIECRPQKPSRDCNERSLLRRYGAGVKILKMITTETYTAYREETVQSSQVSTFNMTVDGGVGGIAY